MKHQDDLFRFHWSDSNTNIDIKAQNLRDAVRKLYQQHPEAGVGYTILKKDESNCWCVID